MKLKTYVIMADKHCPFHSVSTHRSFIKFLKYFKPDGFVILGDFVDNYSISRHLTGILDLEDEGSKQIIKLKKEFDVANSVLDDFDEVLPRNCDKHFIDGNHEYRMDRFFRDGFNGVLEGLFSVEGNLKLKERGYTTHFGYPNSFMELGKLTLTHGSWTPTYTAAKHLNEYRSSVMFGHSHTSQVYYVGGLKHKQVGINIGCQCDPDSKGMSYAKKTSRWIQSWAIVTVDLETGYFWHEVINGFDGKFIYNKKLF